MQIKVEQNSKWSDRNIRRETSKMRLDNELCDMLELEQRK